MQFFKSLFLNTLNSRKNLLHTIPSLALACLVDTVCRRTVCLIWWCCKLSFIRRYCHKFIEPFDKPLMPKKLLLALIRSRIHGLLCTRSCVLIQPYELHLSNWNILCFLKVLLSCQLIPILLIHIWFFNLIRIFINSIRIQGNFLDNMLVLLGKLPKCLDFPII